MQEVKISELKARLVSSELSKNRVHTIPPRMSRRKAEKILAKRRTPKLDPAIVEDTLRWMCEDRSERWLHEWRK